MPKPFLVCHYHHLCGASWIKLASRARACSNNPDPSSALFRLCTIDVSCIRPRLRRSARDSTGACAAMDMVSRSVGSMPGHCKSSNTPIHISRSRPARFSASKPAAANSPIWALSNPSCSADHQIWLVPNSVLRELLQAPPAGRLHHPN